MRRCTPARDVGGEADGDDMGTPGEGEGAGAAAGSRDPSEGGLRHQARLLLVALQFLTRLPVPRFTHWDPRWLEASVRHFPLVGAVVGVIGAAVLVVASLWWPPWVAALLAVAATACVTGAFHEDGLADSFDALGGAVSREKALAIMKDSRIGSYGALALALVTFGRVAALAGLLTPVAGVVAASVTGGAVAAAATGAPAGATGFAVPPLAGPVYAAVALVLAHVLGRTVPVVLMACLPYAGDAEHAKAKPLAVSVRPALAVIALGWAALFVALAVALQLAPLARALVAVAAAAGVGLAMAAWWRRRLGGYTGDTLGAAEQLTELAVLLAFAAAWSA